MKASQGDTGKMAFKHAYDSQLRAIENMVCGKIATTFLANCFTGCTETVSRYREGTSNPHQKSTGGLAFFHFSSVTRIECAA